MIRPGPAPGALSRFVEEEDGVSLIEALVAVIILSTAILALVATAATSTVSLRLSRDRQQAVQTASAALEDVRNMNWDALVLADTPTPPATFETETVVSATGGPLSHVVSDGRFTTTTYVTWANAAETLKRVTTITAWDDRGMTREVRESTLVAIAERGLPVPNFMISPDTSAQQRVSGARVCFPYSVVNLGEKDSYSYQAGKTDGTGNFTAGQWLLSYDVGGGETHEGFKVTDTAGGPWFVWATLGAPTTAGGPSPEMRDVTADQRPDSAGPVERRASAPVEFCAVHHNENSNQSPTPTFTFRLYSAFDDNVRRDATGTVTTTVPTDRLYLVTGGSNQRTRYELSLSKPILTDITTNYDTGNESRPGLRFRPGTVSDRANWDYQPGVSRVEGTATLTFFVANDDSLGTADAIEETIGLQLRIEKLNSQRNTVAVIIDQALNIAEPASGWAQVSVPLAIPTTSFAANEYLRVSLWDRSATDDDGSTHVHFNVNENGTADDATNLRFMSSLDIRVVPQ